MSLLERQIAFRTGIVATVEDGPAGSPGMQIYRDAYRARLLAALEISFERTRRWAGADAFMAAACHYVIAHPPRDWTLDSYGKGFPDLLDALFNGDSEVAELAWLEWQLQQAFGAPDLPRLDPAELAAAGYGDNEWAGLRFAPTAGLALRKTATNCAALWDSLAEDAAADFAVMHHPDQALLVWREGTVPRFRQIDSAEFDALDAIVRGSSFGAVAERCDPGMLGQWLARWLGDGLFAAATL